MMSQLCGAALPHHRAPTGSMPVVCESDSSSVCGRDGRLGDWHFHGMNFFGEDREMAAAQARRGVL